jgi:hypothetical protein
MLYGGKNSIQPKDQVKRFYQLANSKEKNSFIFKNGFHQLFKDEGADEELFPKMLEWIIDESSTKRHTKWTKTEPFNLQVLKPIPKWIKCLAISTLLFLALLIKIHRNRKK